MAHNPWTQTTPFQPVTRIGPENPFTPWQTRFINLSCSCIKLTQPIGLTLLWRFRIQTKKKNNRGIHFARRCAQMDAVAMVRIDPERQGAWSWGINNQ